MAGLANKVALVTGAGRGIGRGIALALARAGVHVAVHYGSSADRAQDVARQAEALGVRAVVVQADMENVAQIQDMVRRTADALGGLDILVNNAGVFSTRRVLDVDEPLWDTVLNTNLKGPFFCAQAAARHMLARGGGVIINIASGGALSPHPGYDLAAPYAASKAGLVMLTRYLALALAPEIRVNAVAPGIIDSKPEPMSQASRQRFAALSPLGMVGEPGDIASAVVFLASDEARFITGQVLAVDGGIAARG